MKLQGLVVAAACTGMTLLTGCGVNNGGPIPDSTFTKLYVAGFNITNNEDTATTFLNGYSLGNGTATQTFSVLGTGDLYDDNDNFDLYSGVAADHSGNLYTVHFQITEEDNLARPRRNDDGNGCTATVLKFSPTTGVSNGAIQPTSTFSSSVLCDLGPGSLGLDGAGNFYFAGEEGFVKFPASAMGQSGDVVPTVEVEDESEGEEGLLARPFYVNSNGDLWVASFSENDDVYTDVVNFYAAGFTNGAAPTRVITPTTPTEIFGLTVDGSGKVYTAGVQFEDNEDDVIPVAGVVNVYAAGAGGSTPVTPAQTIGYSVINSTLQVPLAVAVDGNGSIFVELLGGTEEQEAVVTRASIGKKLHAAIARPSVDNLPQYTTTISSYPAGTNGNNLTPAATFTVPNSNGNEFLAGLGFLLQ